MSSTDQNLVFDFIMAALLRSEKFDVLQAGNRAGELLKQVLELNEAALVEVASLCNAADYWDEEWQDSSARVRSVLARHFARGEPSLKPKDPGRRGPAAERQARGKREGLPRASQMEEYERRFEAFAVTASREARDLEALDAWLSRTSKPLAEFFALWEVMPEPAQDPRGMVGRKGDPDGES